MHVTWTIDNSGLPDIANYATKALGPHLRAGLN